MLAVNFLATILMFQFIINMLDLNICKLLKGQGLQLKINIDMEISKFQTLKVRISELIFSLSL
jgi:hypothetical protein